MKIFQYLLTSIYLYLYSREWIYAAITVESPTLILPPINDKWAGDSIAMIIAWGISLTAVLTIIAITWAGIQMVLAVGEEEKMKKARHTMIYAFIGLIIAWLAYAIVYFVVNINLNNFLTI